MPILKISTNINLDGIDLDPVFSECTEAIASIIGRNPELVMVLINGSVPLKFGNTKDPAAFADLLSMGGINKSVKKRLISSLSTIIEARLAIPAARFVCNVVDLSIARSKM